MKRAVILFLLFFGLLFVIIEIAKVRAGIYKKDPTIIYRYIPRTFEEEQEYEVPVSDIFETMFSQPSPWLGSIRTYDIKKQDKINQYFVSQL